MDTEDMIGNLILYNLIKKDLEGAVAPSVSFYTLFKQISTYIYSWFG